MFMSISSTELSESGSGKGEGNLAGFASSILVISS